MGGNSVRHADKGGYQGHIKQLLKTGFSQMNRDEKHLRINKIFLEIVVITSIHLL